MSAPTPAPDAGLLLVVNGRPRRLRALSLTDGPRGLPVWLADVDGQQAAAGTLEAAILLAGRSAGTVKEA